MQWLTNIFAGSQKSEKKIREIFFNLIQNNRGSITEIDLAMAANISGTDAKKYLEQFAVEFDAIFEITEQGQVVYLFPISNYANKSNNLNADRNNLSKSQENPKSANFQPKERKSNNLDLDVRVANIKKNVKNTEKEIQENLSNIDSDLKNIGDSLNNLFK